jgi:hypothetical protein
MGQAPDEAVAGSNGAAQVGDLGLEVVHSVDGGTGHRQGFRRGRTGADEPSVPQIAGVAGPGFGGACEAVAVRVDGNGEADSADSGELACDGVARARYGSMMVSHDATPELLGHFI